MTLHDLLEELSARDEAIEKLVIAYFKLEAERDALVQTVRELTTQQVRRAG